MRPGTASARAQRQDTEARTQTMQRCLGLVLKPRMVIVREGGGGRAAAAAARRRSVGLRPTHIIACDGARACAKQLGPRHAQRAVGRPGAGRVPGTHPTGNFQRAKLHPVFPREA
jgi:hypothetical protein